MYSLGEYYIVIPKILKVWPSYIAGKRSFVAFPIYQISGPTLFLVAQVYLIFYQYISQIYLKCTCCVRWGGGCYTPHPPPPVATSLDMTDEDHKTELLDLFNDIISQIDKLPLHPKNKILLYNRYLFSKISWHFTVTNISKTWSAKH